VQERLEVDHFHAGDAQDGEHKKLTLGAPIATPANVANKGFLYGKDVGGKIELHWLDEDGNEVALTAVGSINVFAATTSILFYQSAAPAGWTKDVAATLNDHGIRVVTDTAWAAGSNGTDAFTTVFSATKKTEDHTLILAEIPSHPHTTHGGVSNVSGGNHNWWGGASAEGSENTGSAGGDGAHAHDITMDLNYISVIRATKD
ncbi:hypothetical protein LCGC14_2972900, partial [marine sediment metagenome]